MKINLNLTKKQIIVVLTFVLILVFSGIAWGNFTSNITKDVQSTVDVTNNQDDLIQRSIYGTEDPFQNPMNNENDPIVYITDTGSKYHLIGCRYLDESEKPIHLSEAIKKYKPCSVCKPPYYDINNQSAETGIPVEEHPPIPGAMGDTKVLSTNPNDYKDSYSVEQKVLEENKEVVDSVQQNNGYTFLFNSDLGLGIDNNIWVGVNKFSEFSEKYSDWQKSNGPSQFPGKSKAEFYNSVDEHGYPYSMVTVQYSTKTNVIKEIFYNQRKHMKGDLVFKTDRDISSGSTIAQVIKAYGNIYTANIVHNPNYELCNYTYKFVTKNGFKGVLEFYGTFSKGQSVESARVDGIRLSVE